METVELGNLCQLQTYFLGYMTFLNFQLSLDSPRNQIFFFPTLFFVYSMPNRICDVYYIHCVRACVCVCVCVCVCMCVCVCVTVFIDMKGDSIDILIILCIFFFVIFMIEIPDGKKNIQRTGAGYITF